MLIPSKNASVCILDSLVLRLLFVITVKFDEIIRDNILQENFIWLLLKYQIILQHGSSMGFRLYRPDLIRRTAFRKLDGVALLITDPPLSSFTTLSGNLNLYIHIFLNTYVTFDT